ncbi:hypothetical protein G6O69_06945 [Pseudenhygromyxa sp. WMMC2535]|uniref:PA14 domain-containing protein n=1 Tax=Pseudenhygromyxa sp. WMMC2535 TaxID=2712867 RepID=UPI00155510B3|nr:PA14 domain-containing protein [Pseudenhygromyxa sp. WMMC2535]NVB37563.1 hypothetical protein [Pseudenhygromyxa sp. WMMC2535]
MADQAMKKRGALAARPGWPELCSAAEELHAAEILLQDPVAAPHTAIPHLQAFWRQATAAGAAAGLEGASGGAEAWLGHAIPGVNEGARKRLRAQLGALLGERAAAEVGPRDLRRHTKAARELLSALEPELGGQPLRRRRRRILLGVAGVFVVLAPLITYTALNTNIPGTGPWRAAYYPDRMLESEPLVVRDDTVTHAWEDRPPLEEIPPDKFSVRWDSCLVVDEAGLAIMQVNANDGARVFLDGETIIDAWDRDTATRRKGFGSASLDLEPGVHHLRVEFYESLGRQSISLVASFDGAVPKEIPRERLRYPGDEIDEQDPCAAVRAELQ